MNVSTHSSLVFHYFGSMMTFAKTKMKLNKAAVSSNSIAFLSCCLVLLCRAVDVVTAEDSEQCLSDPTLSAQLAEDLGGEAPLPGSCCQQDVCNIPCPEPVPPPSKGFGIAVGLTIAVSFAIGVATIFVVKGEPENYFVAGHSLPLWIVAMTLGAQSVDSNALLGNVDLSYKYQFFDVSIHNSTETFDSFLLHRFAGSASKSLTTFSSRLLFLRIGSCHSNWTRMFTSIERYFLGA